MAALAPAAAELSARPLESAYSPREGKWEITWPERVSQHDVVYLSPPEDPSLGLPLGNGDLGALLWTSETQLIIALNKCDIWDDNTPGPFRGWGAEDEEHQTTLRHCGRLVVDFGCPVFDLLYQKNFEARLGLATATASLDAQTPFGSAAASSYISSGHRVLVLNVQTNAPEPVPASVTLERWGSRTFAHWYSQVNRDPALGLDGTRTDVQRSRIVIEQKLRTMTFVVAAQVVADAGVAAAPRRLHSRAGTVDLAPATSRAFTVYVTVVTSENHADPLAAAHRTLDRAVAARETAVRAAHQSEWKQFWAASMIDLPEKYLENIWHTNLYLANSSARGAYPPHFCNGLWGWNRDFVPWNYYFHWNMQWHAWPLAAANHAELARPYQALRLAQLPRAIEYARDRLKKPGAFYADVSDRHGYNDQGLNHNQTPGAQVALEFWRHYAYTQDEQFLRGSAWPIIREVTRYNSASLMLGDDGFWHIHHTSAYEGSPLFDDTITDLSMIRALFPVALRVGKALGHDAAELAVWEKQLRALAPFHFAELSDLEYERRGEALLHRGGLATGTPLTSAKVFAVGRNDKGEWVRNRFAGHPEKAYYGIPDPELAPVFPSGVVGLARRNDELFRAAVTQVRLHPSATPGEADAKGTMSGLAGLCMGWCPFPIALARLGLADELARELANSISTWQFYPQGFGHYGPYGVFRPDQQQRWHVNMARDASTVRKGAEPVKFPFPTWPFRHFDNEPMPIAACAMNEMLLQSHEEVIRVCPAVPADWSVRFDLAAMGGFRVSAERAKGQTQWVAIVGRRTATCRLVRPWGEESPVVCLDITAGRDQPVPLTVETILADQVLVWRAEAGHRYLVLRDGALLANWKVVRQTPARRTGPRHLKDAILGRDRLY
jgi:hypothetical protein